MEIMEIIDIIGTPITIIISLIIGLKTYSFHRKKLAAQIISTHRRVWINGLRQVCREFVDLYYRTYRTTGAMLAKKYEVELFLDDDDGENNLYKNLREQMNTLVNKKRADSAMSEFVALSQQIIQCEWDKIKLESGKAKQRNDKIDGKF